MLNYQIITVKYSNIQIQNNYYTILLIKIFFLGLTEVGGALCKNKNRNMIDSVGFVCKNIELKIIDPQSNKPLGPNEVGEICIKSPSLMIGYYKNPKATSEILDEEGK